MVLRAGGWLLRVSPQSLRADALAGLLGAVLVLPQAVAFATLAGLPPQMGLATAVLPCIVAAVFGSSRYVVSGPTNANSLALYAMLTPLAAAASPEYIQLALTVTLLIGVMQLCVGLLRLGLLANFISPAALQGFTSGAALLIAVHALHDLLGIALPGGQGAGAVLLGVVERLGTMQPAALAVGALTLVVAALVRRANPRWPALLAGLAAGTAAAALVSLNDAWVPVRTIGVLPSDWLAFGVPAIDLARLPELTGLAFALTIVALGQSFSVAKLMAARSGERLDVNREFVGQGLSNIVGGLASGYVSCGSLNRSLPNLEAGARTPLAAVFSAFALALLVALASPLLAKMPYAAIAALLLVVAWGLLDLPRWRALRRMSRSEFAIALATLAATLAVRLELAILFGTLLSLVAYLYRTSRPALRSMGFDSRAPERRLIALEPPLASVLPECPQLKLLRMEGSVYFGAVAHVAEHLHALREGPSAPRHLLVMAKSMNFIDLAGAELWHDELRARRTMGGGLYFHRPRPAVMDTWARTGFVADIGPEHLFPDKRHALAFIVPRLDLAICDRCSARIFHECPPAPAGLHAAPTPPDD